MRRRIPEELQHRFTRCMTNELPEKADVYCIDEFDVAFELHMTKFKDDVLTGMACLVGARVYFMSASCEKNEERILQRTFDCPASRYKTAYEISTNATSNIEMSCSIYPQPS